MTFRYPEELNTGDVDYVIFTPHQYVANSGKDSAGRSGRDLARGGFNGPATGAPVVLYMPTSTPSVTNTNSFGDVSFSGPLGAITRNLSRGAASAVNRISSVETAREEIANMGEQLKDSAGNVPGAARQFLVQGIAEMSSADANQLMALANGEIYNPNIELLYKGPKVRGFNFSYTFVPKSAKEAAEVNKIIKHFKKHSAPSNTGNGMYKVPDIFSVVYMHKGSVNPNMNQFMRSALTSIAVQANPGLPMHMSFENGMPIVSQISMTFTEVDVITREDHETSYSNIGY